MIAVKEIKSKDNKLIKYIQRLNSSSSFRKKEKLFFCEGLRLCNDALKSGTIIKSAFFSSSAVEKYSGLLEDFDALKTDIYLIADGVFKLIAETQTPQGVAVLCEIPQTDKADCSFKTAAALERIQDPQNMGTILRSAEAFGIDCVVLSKDCCDIFSPKVLRGSMGAVFRQKIIIPNDFCYAIEEMNNSGVKTYAAVPRSGGDVLDADFSAPACVIIGNEGNGLSERVIELCRDKITINMNGNAESLNAAVASSILMWEMIRGNDK